MKLNEKSTKSGKRFFAKKQVVTSVLVLILAVAIYINWKYADPDGGLKTTAATSSSQKTGQAEYVATGNVSVDTQYFSDARKDREKYYSDTIAELEEIENSAKATEEEKALAYQSHIAFAERQSKQTDIESLIKAKGFPDCVTVLSDEGASVVVYAETLSNSEILQIQDIVTSNYDVSLENIKIINIK